VHESVGNLVSEREGRKDGVCALIDLALKLPSVIKMDVTTEETQSAIGSCFPVFASARA
jgi:hypothetical protein